MRKLITELRREFITEKITNWVLKNPIRYSLLLDKITKLRDTAENEWKVTTGSSEFYSHFTELPEDLFESIDGVLEPGFLETFAERKWFAKTFPKLLVRNKKDAIRADFRQNLRGL